MVALGYGYMTDMQQMVLNQKMLPKSIKGSAAALVLSELSTPLSSSHQLPTYLPLESHLYSTLVGIFMDPQNPNIFLWKDLLRIYNSVFSQMSVFHTSLSQFLTYTYANCSII